MLEKLKSEKAKNAREFFKEEGARIAKLLLLVYVAAFLAWQLIGSFWSRGVNTDSVNPKAASELKGWQADKDKGFPVEKEDSIIIPKINIDIPFSAVSSINPEDFKGPLKKGAAQYPSVPIGQKGQSVILGHSAPSYWPKINYDWIFSDLNKLEAGDEIIIIFNNRQYVYEVKNKSIVKQGQALPVLYPDNSKPEIVLVSCWPPGINNKRIAVQAELKNH